VEVEVTIHGGAADDAGAGEVHRSIALRIDEGPELRRQIAVRVEVVGLDLLGRTEEFPRVARAPKEYEGKSIVLYGVRAGELRPIESRFSMPFASSDGRATIAATERPANNQFYLVMTDGFAREARERRLLAGGAARGPLFVECRVVPQTAGRVTSYPCEIDKLVAIVNDRVSESLWRARGGALEYFRY